MRLSVLRPAALLVPFTLLLACGGQGPAPTPAPAGGRDVLAAMHDRYAGKWFRTLTFEQTTGQHRPDGTVQESTWYEAVKSPDRLRIDIGHPALGNGVLYTADSMYVMRNGQLARASGEGNPFLPFVVGVYTQPVERTVAQLAPFDIDLGRMYTTTVDGKRTYVVGAESAADSTSPQFWVEAERLILTRMILALGGPSAPPFDVKLAGYEPIGDSWLATDITMSTNGQVRQTEKYTKWTVNPDLSAGLFEPAQWASAKHWVSLPPK